MVFILGMIAGIWIFAAGMPLWGSFYMSSDLGRLTLWQVFGVPMWAMALIILGMALMAFALAGFGEKWAPYDK
jgi:hypothetical protein